MCFNVRMDVCERHVYTRHCKNRYQFEERTRGRLVDKLRDERWRVLRQRDAPQGLEQEHAQNSISTFGSLQGSPDDREGGGRGDKYWSDSSTLDGSIGDITSPSFAVRVFSQTLSRPRCLARTHARTATHRPCIWIGCTHLRPGEQMAIDKMRGVKTAAMQKEAAARLAEGLSADESAHRPSHFGTRGAMRDMTDIGKLLAPPCVKRACVLCCYGL